MYINFKFSVTFDCLSLQETVIKCGNSLTELLICTPFDPEDNNELQTFPVQAGNSQAAVEARYMKIEFHASTDFYGRITVYQLKATNDFNEIL